MPTEPTSLGTLLFIVGVVLPFTVVLVSAIIGLVQALTPSSLPPATPRVNSRPRYLRARQCADDARWTTNCPAARRKSPSNADASSTCLVRITRKLT